MVLKVHHLRPAPGAKKARTRKGRGEASKGKTAGRGGKGTRARNVVRAGFEGGQLPLVMRLPKLRGFKNPERVEYQPVNVSTINALYPKGAARDGHPVKVLGNGDISVKVTVVAHAFSSSASEKIAAAGGSITKL